MKFLNKIYRKLFPRKFNHNPQDFKIKAVESWFSPFWYEIKYSANNGESWEYLYKSSPPLFSHSYDTLLEYDWGWKKIAFKPEKMGFEEFKNKFKTYQDVLDFYSKEEEKIKRGKVERLKQLEYYKNKFNNNIK